MGSMILFLRFILTASIRLDAVPFDLISYHLVGHSSVNGVDAKEVVSIPKFIEVRPFREDAEGSSQGGGDGQEQDGDNELRQEMLDILDMIHQILTFELTLNKAVFAARASGMSADDPIFQEQIGLLKYQLVEPPTLLDEFLTETNPERLTVNMTSSLRAAEEHMDAAARQLEKLSPEEERSVVQ
jgi:hypothetical protein